MSMDEFPGEKKRLHALGNTCPQPAKIFIGRRIQAECDPLDKAYGTGVRTDMAAIGEPPCLQSNMNSSGLVSPTILPGKMI
jgi:hypothetical protein